MKNSTLLALLISAAPVAAQAEIVTGALTLSYTEHSNDFGDMTTTGLDGRMVIDMENGLTFGLDLGQSSMSVDGIPIDIESDFYGLNAKYAFGNGMNAGVYMDRFAIGLDGIPIELTLKSKGVTLGYVGNGFEAEAFYGNTDVIMVDIDNFGVAGSYTGMEGLELGAVYHRSRLSIGGSSENLDFKGVAGTYMATPSLMVFGGFGTLDVLGMGDLDSMGLGISYDLAGATGFASSLSLEYGQTSLDGLDLDVIRVGWTIPLGKKGAVLPMNSVADSILNPRHGALVAGLTSGF